MPGSKEYQKSWYEANKERVLQQQREYYQRTKQARRARQKKYVEENYENVYARNRATYLARKYGITEEEYNSMLADQHGVCYICHGEETKMYRGKPDRLCVDHDHKTGKVRKLLCSTCNKALGLLLDSPELLRFAADYIEEHQ